MADNYTTKITILSLFSKKKQGINFALSIQNFRFAALTLP